MVDRQRLTRAERADLLLWVEARQNDFIANGVTFYQAAIKATKELGFKVTRRIVLNLANANSLRWYGQQVTINNKKAWRCARCGGRCLSKECLVCKARQSKERNADSADQHGIPWAKAQHLKGRFDNGRRKENV